MIKINTMFNKSWFPFAVHVFWVKDGKKQKKKHISLNSEKQLSLSTVLINQRFRIYKLFSFCP